MNENTKNYILEVTEQIRMALESDKTPETVKDCLKTIIIEAATEADLTLSDFIFSESVPLIFEKLNPEYGRGFLHSIAAILRHDTPAFQEFYDKRLDEKPPSPPPIENVRKDEIKLKRDEIIKHEEIEQLISSLVTDAEFAPYAIYGLMFLFGSIKKSLEAGNTPDIENICISALLKIYSLSENGYEAIERLTKNIHVHYRAADWKRENQNEICQPFIASECAEAVESENILDLSAQPLECQHLNSLAAQISEIMKNPNLPARLYNALTDELTKIYVDTDSAENILLNLKDLPANQEEKERGNV